MPALNPSKNISVRPSPKPYLPRMVPSNTNAASLMRKSPPLNKSFFPSAKKSKQPSTPTAPSTSEIAPAKLPPNPSDAATPEILPWRSSHPPRKPDNCFLRPPITRPLHTLPPPRLSFSKNLPPTQPLKANKNNRHISPPSLHLQQGPHHRPPHHHHRSPPRSGYRRRRCMVRPLFGG